MVFLLVVDKEFLNMVRNHHESVPNLCLIRALDIIRILGPAVV